MNDLANNENNNIANNIMSLPKALRRKLPNPNTTYGQTKIGKHFREAGKRFNVYRVAEFYGSDPNDNKAEAYAYLADVMDAELQSEIDEYNTPKYIKHRVSPTSARNNDEDFLKNLFIKYKLKGKQRFLFKFEGELIRDISVNIPNKSYNSMFDNDPDIATFVERCRKDSEFYLWFYLVWGGDWENLTDPTFTPSPNLEIFITTDITLSKKIIEQTFNNGGYCLIGKVYDWLLEKHDEVKSPASKKRYITKINKFNDFTQKNGVEKIGYLTKYKNGIPDQDLDAFANQIQIEIRIVKPFSDEIYLHIIPLKKPLRTFNFTNTDINHVEANPNNTLHYFNTIYTNDFKDTVKVEDYTQMNALVDELMKNNEPFIGTSGLNGYTSVKTMSAIYEVDDDFCNTCLEFESDTGMNSADSSWKYDAIKHPKLNNFISSGTHFNGTVDFNDVYELDVKEFKANGGEHIDMKKAYSQFKNSKYYSGFMRRPAEFRKVNNFKRKGLYLIDNLDFSNADRKFRILNSKMRWFVDNNIYTDAELHALTDLKVKFDVLAGAMGVRGDFEFKGKMLDSKQVISKKLDIKISYYAKWTGKCASQKYNTSFCMGGSKKFFQNITSKNTAITYNEYTNMGTITYPKEALFTLKHIASQITAYQRLVVLEQLLKMDISKVVRVCVDGIYFYKHDCEINTDIFQDKSDSMTFNNSASTNYLSTIIINEDDDDAVELEDGYEEYDDAEIELPSAEPREYYQKELHIGAGGTGKTTSNLLDEGFIDVLYIAPSWKLAVAMKEDFKDKFNKELKVSVLARLQREPYRDALIKYNANILCDEASQYTEETKLALFNNDVNRLIVVGDLGFQLPPIMADGQGVEMNDTGFDNVVRYTSKDQRRFKCEKLKFITNTLRGMIEKNNHTNYAMAMLKNNVNVITQDDLKNIYQKEDIILASQHIFKDAYTEMFEDNKYIVNENTRLYKKGQIIYDDIDELNTEKRHGFTIHSVQGETFINKIFIDVRKHKSIRMLYTAVSRAKTIDQIYLINVKTEETPKQE